MSIFKKPSFWCNGIQGILILCVLVISWMYRKDLSKLSIYEKCVLLLLFGLVIGVHGLLHLGLEKVYDWNPLEGKWI